MLTYLLMTLLIITAVFLIILVLIQRGKGGGLAGAFGGMGGQSAFGTKAGDLFTKITVGVAFFWILLCMVAVKMMGGQSAGPLDTSKGGGLRRRATAAGQRAALSGKNAPQRPDAGGAGEIVQRFRIEGLYSG